MAYLHHGSIRKYTAALLDVFNDLEVQYKSSTGNLVVKEIPLKYSNREKSRILDDYTAEQILSGNHNVLPRATLVMVSMEKGDARVMNKNHKIGRFKGTDSMEYMFNSVPYVFNFDLNVQCRGMNEATQIIEQIAPVFNPILNIDVWDVDNLGEPTRVPVELNNISIDDGEYEELSTNIITIGISLSLTGNIYQPIKSTPRIKEFGMSTNVMTEYSDIANGETVNSRMLEWDVNPDGTLTSKPESPV